MCEKEDEKIGALAPTRVRLPTNHCIKRVNWLKEEDELLLSLVGNSKKPNWSKIAAQFPNRTTQQVTDRWDKVINPELIKGSWTRKEDETIIKFVEENGCKNWTKLSTLLPGRIGKQCRERWRNHLDPNINHSPWTTEEDLAIIRLHEQFGNQWVKIATMMNHRSDNAIKNRWNSTLKKIDKSSIPGLTEPQRSVMAYPPKLKVKENLISSVEEHKHNYAPIVTTIGPFGFIAPPALNEHNKSEDSEAVQPRPSSPRVASSVEKNRAQLRLLMEGQ